VTSCAVSTSQHHFKIIKKMLCTQFSEWGGGSKYRKHKSQYQVWDMQVSQSNYLFPPHCSWHVFSLTQVNWNTCRKTCSTTTCPPHISHGLAWGQTQDSMVRCLWLTALIMVWSHLQRCPALTTWTVRPSAHWRFFAAAVKQPQRLLQWNVLF